MRAVVFDRYGPPEVLRVEEVERPVPKPNEVLVRVHASTTTRTDCGLRGAEYLVARLFTGVFRPRVGRVGIEFAGDVEAVGGEVSGLAVGDRVFGIAEGSADFESGQRVAVYGASGSIGVGVVQVAAGLGGHVTAVCRAEHDKLMRSLGADQVVDSETADFATSGHRYDVVLDAAGKTTFLRCRRALAAGGRYVTTDPGFLWQDAAVSLTTRRAKLGIVRYERSDLDALAGMVRDGRYRAVVDRTYPIEDVVEAHRYVEMHQKTGNVVLTVR